MNQRLCCEIVFGIVFGIVLEYSLEWSRNSLKEAATKLFYVYSLHNKIAYIKEEGTLQWQYKPMQGTIFIHDNEKFAKRAFSCSHFLVSYFALALILKL